jgi:hypothetical protein
MVNNRKTQHFSNFILPTKGCKIALRVIDKPGSNSRSMTSWIYGEVTSIIKYKARCVIIESRFTKDEAKMKIGVRKDTLKFSLFGRAPPKIWYVLAKGEEKKFTPFPTGDGVKEVKMKAVLAEPNVMMMELKSEEEEEEEGEREEEDGDKHEIQDVEELPSKKKRKRGSEAKEDKEAKEAKEEEESKPKPKKEDPIHSCLTCEMDFKESEMNPLEIPGKWMCADCSGMTC